MTIQSMRAACRVAAAALFFGGATLAGPAFAAKLGPYFPLPNGVAMTGIPKDSLIAANIKWLENGIDNLKKAREKETAADKQQEIDKLLGEAEEELKLANDRTGPHEVQVRRKDALLLNINQWINELEHQATEQMKRAILSDGAEKMEAEKRNEQLSEQADQLQKAKNDNSMVNWK